MKKAENKEIPLNFNFDWPADSLAPSKYRPLADDASSLLGKVKTMRGNLILLRPLTERERRNKKKTKSATYTIAA